MESLRPAVDRQPGEHHDRNRIRHIATYAACCELMRDGEVPPLERSGELVRLGVELEAEPRQEPVRVLRLVKLDSDPPVVEHGLAAVEVIQSVRGRQGLRRPDLQVQAFTDFLPQGAFTAMRRSRPGFWAGGASSSFVNCRNLSASRLKNT